MYKQVTIIGQPFEMEYFHFSRLLLVLDLLCQLKLQRRLGGGIFVGMRLYLILELSHVKKAHISPTILNALSFFKTMTALCTHTFYFGKDNHGGMAKRNTLISSIEGCFSSYVILDFRSSSTKHPLPSMVILHEMLSSIKSNFPFRVAFH